MLLKIVENPIARIMKNPSHMQTFSGIKRHKMWENTREIHRKKAPTALMTAADERGIFILLHSYAMAARKMSTLTITDSIISRNKISPHPII